MHLEVKRTILNVSPQVVSTFLFETGSFNDLEMTHIGRVNWPLCFQGCACLCLPFYCCWVYIGWMGSGDPYSEPHAYKASPLLTESFP